MKKYIFTNNAPAAIGTYSQAVSVNQTIYLSGQIGLNPNTMELVSSDFKDQAEQMFKNMKQVVLEAGCEMNNIVKVNLYLLDMDKFSIINEVMAKYFNSPYPARAAVAVSGLPKNAQVEMEAIAVLD
jgi:reactive intermediate/imine deaminase